MVDKFKGSGRQRDGGFPAVHRQDFRAHTTGGDWRHEAAQIDMNPQPTAPFGGATVQTTLDNTTTFLNDRSQLIIENDDFTGSGTDPALEISGNSTPIHYKNCTFTATSGADSWALVVGTSTRLVFENCTFSGPEGQIIRCINAGVHFINCYFNSSSGTTLTNPQAILGYGFTSGDDDSQALQFTNCRLSYGTSNVETSTAPTLAIVELGGNGNIGFEGRVVIDGFYVKPENSSVGVHNYTTFLVHNNAGDTPHYIKNLTIDANDTISTGTGTLSGIDGTGALLEVTANELDGYTKTTIDALNILNVRNPTASHARNIAYFERCIINNFVFDGSSETGVGEYQSNLIVLDACDLNNFTIFPNNPVSATRIFNFVQIVKAIDGRIKTWDVAYTNIINFDTDNTLTNVYIYLNVEQDDTIFRLNVPLVLIDGCFIQSSITSSTIPLITTSSGAVGLRFVNNFVGWDISINDRIANFGSTANCIITSNYFAKGFAFSGAPVVTYGDTGSIGSDSHNIRAAVTATLSFRGNDWGDL